MATIERAVPLPEAGNAAKYPFAEMALGDCLFFEDLQKVESAQAAAIRYAKRNDIDFKVTRRKLDGGYGLWRIK